MEIRKNTFNFFMLGIIAIMHMACTKDSTNLITNLPVVQAYLMPGKPISVKLYYQKSLTDTSKYGSPITNQVLFISDGVNNVQLTETQKGTYTYSDNTFLAVGKTYTLSFNYLSSKVTAKTVIPQKPTNFATQHSTVYFAGSSTDKIDSLNKFTWSNPDSTNHIIVFVNVNGTYTPIAKRVFGNREIISQFDTKRKSYYYITTSNFSFYGQYQVILLSANQEYIDLVNSDASGVNTQKLLNVPTNIVNGLGIFTGLQADTLNFNLEQI